MNKPTRPSIWRSKPGLLIAYIVFCLVAVFSLYAFGSYAIAQRYGVAKDQLWLMRLIAMGLLIATLGGLARVSRTFIAAARNSAPNTDRLVRRAIIRALLAAAILVASFLLMTVWFYNLR